MLCDVRCAASAPTLPKGEGTEEIMSHVQETGDELPYQGAPAECLIHQETQALEWPRDLERFRRESAFI
jgi:hypothetical protein